MNGIRNEKQLTIVKVYDFNKPLIHKIDSIFEAFIRDCHKKTFRTFEWKGKYNISFTIIENFEIVNLTISDKSMHLYKLN